MNLPDRIGRGRALKRFLFPSERGRLPFCQCDRHLFLPKTERIALLKKSIFILMLCCLLLLSGCGKQNAVLPSEVPTETAVTFTDDMGRQVTVDRPQRVACLIASFADI